MIFHEIFIHILGVKQLHQVLLNSDEKQKSSILRTVRPLEAAGTQSSLGMN